MNDVLLAVLLDLALGEPPARAHPVVGMGAYLRVRRAAWRAPDEAGRFREGARDWTLGAAASLAAGALLDRVLPRGRRGAVARAALLKPLFSARALLEAVEAVRAPLAAGDLPEARRLLGWHLVSRDTADLSAEEVAGAAIESLFENLSDSVVAPLLAYRVGGLAGAALYRFANTADASWGYRTPELEARGRVAARADDLLNLVPARLTALLIVLAAGPDAPGARRVWGRDARLTASPNAGHPMAAAAGALGVRLDKRGVYTLNPEGRPPGAPDVRRALALARRALALGVALAALVPPPSQGDRRA